MEIVRAGGGTRFSSFRNFSTFVVTDDYEQVQENHPSLPPGCKIVSFHWLEQCYKHKKRVDPQPCVHNFAIFDFCAHGETF